MKNKIIIAFVVISEIFGLVGCKPKETTVTVTGEVFIVTRGAENIKLGLVEVQLIPKQQVSAFLKIKTPMIQAEILSCQKECVTKGEEALKATRNLALFVADGPLTKPEYFSMKNEYDHLIQERFQLAHNLDLRVNQLGTEVNAMNEEYNKGKLGEGLATYEKITSGKTNCEEIQNEITNNMLSASELKMKLDKIEADANSAEGDLEQKNKEAQLRLDKAKTMLSEYPTGESYFADFSPLIIQKELTDADGKFSLTYPRDSDLTFFAKADRMVGTQTEKYFWLINAPTNAESVQIFLSNNNLVTVDPDGYFNIKPVAASEESEASQPTSGN